METIRTSDFYEAAYYLAEGFPPESIACRRLNKDLLCDFYYSDPSLKELQVSFFSGKAHVNLFSFRRSYGELVNRAGRVKREYQKKAKEASTTPAPTGAAALKGGSR